MGRILVYRNNSPFYFEIYIFNLDGLREGYFKNQIFFQLNIKLERYTNKRIHRGMFIK